MSLAIPSSIKCRITGVEHKIVNGSVNQIEFHDYLKGLVQRLNSGQTIIIAIDCEGWCLGTIKNSLGLIQMAECFSPDVLYCWPLPKVSINLQPGFMIKTPISQETIQLMNSVFTHENIRLLTFDFTSDFVSMMEIGLRFNFNNVIDSQLNYMYNNIEFFTVTRLQGLKRVCEYW